MLRKKLHASRGKLPVICAITFNQERYIQLEIYSTQEPFNIHQFLFFPQDVNGPSSKACGKHSKVLSLISYIGCALSILGLTLTIFTFGFFK